MKTNQIMITLVVAIVVGAAAFYGGMQYQKSQRPSFGDSQGGVYGAFRRGGNGNGSGGRFVARVQVVSIDANGITVKLQDGSSKLVLINGSTQIGQSQKASQSDIKTGDTVMTIGTTNSDGSVTAQDVQINPQEFGRPSPSGARQ